MTVLVSGASGFLGSRLVERLAADGREVVAVARRPVPEAFRSNPRIRWLVRDIAQDGLAPLALPHINAAVHLAGATLGAGKDESMFLRANEQTTVHLCQALADRTKRFVFASSQVVYGDARHLSVTEDFPLQSDGSAYACSKLNSENWLRWFQKYHGGQYLALRFCGFINGGGIVDYLIDQALDDQSIELFSNGRVRRDYLTSADGVHALLGALERDVDEGFLPVNIGSGQALSALDLANIVLDEVGSSSKIVLSDAQSPQGDFVFNINRARALFGFRPGNLAEAVRLHARARKEAVARRVSGAKN